MDDDAKLEAARACLMKELEKEIHNRRILDVIRSLPREEFVPADLKEMSYENIPLTIGHGQTISQPYTVAFMLELLDVKDEQKILEIGTGSGYNAAIISKLVGSKGEVVSMETVNPLAEKAQATLKRLGYNNVLVVVGDGSIGCRKHAPFDRIIVTAASPGICGMWTDQLKDGGVIVAPVGRMMQEMMVVKKTGDGFVEERHGCFQFVPLVGEKGF